MKFIIDTQLPFKLSNYLKLKGHDCIHTTDTPDGHLLEDEKIIRIAVDSGRTVVTKDQDFKENFQMKGAPPSVLFLSFGNISNKKLLEYFDEHFDTILSLFNEGQEFVEFNRTGIFVQD